MNASVDPNLNVLSRIDLTSVKASVSHVRIFSLLSTGVDIFTKTQLYPCWSKHWKVTQVKITIAE